MLRGEACRDLAREGGLRDLVFVEADRERRDAAAVARGGSHDDAGIDAAGEEEA